MTHRYNEQEACPYCKGQGYFQLIIGGSESCPNCDGAGIPSQESIQPIALMK